MANVGTNGASLYQANIASSASVATDSNGVFIAGSAFSSVVIQTFTGDGTFTPSSGMKFCVIECVGGGAGGGGSISTAGGLSVGSGGGSGEYARGRFTASDIGASKAVTIGAGGGGNSGTTGSNGGTTSVGALITALGGTGGTTTSLAIVKSISTPGGAGGTGGSGGSYRVNGNQGGLGWASATDNMAIGGSGNGSPYAGSVNSASIVDSAIAQTTVGTAATGYGGGGGGALTYVTATAQLGGAGSGGIVVITEYI